MSNGLLTLVLISDVIEIFIMKLCNVLIENAIVVSLKKNHSHSASWYPDCNVYQ
jgi:hypothetical protein